MQVHVRNSDHESECGVRASVATPENLGSATLRPVRETTEGLGPAHRQDLGSRRGHGDGGVAQPLLGDFGCSPSSSSRVAWVWRSPFRVTSVGRRSWRTPNPVVDRGVEHGCEGDAGSGASRSRREWCQGQIVSSGAVTVPSSVTRMGPVPVTTSRNAGSPMASVSICVSTSCSEATPAASR